MEVNRSGTWCRQQRLALGEIHFARARIIHISRTCSHASSVIEALHFTGEGGPTGLGAELADFSPHSLDIHLAPRVRTISAVRGHQIRT